MPPPGAGPGPWPPAGGPGAGEGAARCGTLSHLLTAHAYYTCH